MDTWACIKIEEDETGMVEWSGGQCVSTRVKTEPGPIDNSVLAAVMGSPVAPYEASRPRPMEVNKDGAAQRLSIPCRVKTHKYDGKRDWEAFRAQLEILAAANGWSLGQRDLQLALCLTGDTLSCLLLLDPVERGDCEALTSALQRRFDQCFRLELLRSELSGRRRRGGEFLQALANNVESLTRRAYAHMPPDVQNELARDPFVRVLSPPDLRVHPQLARQHSLHAHVPCRRLWSMHWRKRW